MRNPNSFGPRWSISLERHRKAMQAANNIFTASQIARALEREPRTIQRALSGIAATQTVVKGGAARAWELSALPVELQKRLVVEAERRGYRNAEQLLGESEKKDAAITPGEM